MKASNSDRTILRQENEKLSAQSNGSNNNFECNDKESSEEVQKAAAVSSCH